MLIAARAMQTALAVLKPRLAEGSVTSSGKVLIGTVKGDLHDIGKNLVGTMLSGGGFDVVDLGTNATPSAFVEAVGRHRPDVLCMSALSTTTMQNMDLTLSALKRASVRQDVVVVVGGAPVTEEFAVQIGADGYAPDASRAVTKIRSLLERAARAIALLLGSECANRRRIAD